MKIGAYKGGGMQSLKSERNVLGISPCLNLISLCLFSLVCVGCSKQYQDLPAFSPFPFTDAQNYSVGRFKTTYLADQIHAYYRGSIRGPIAVATFVELDDLYGSSTFGRLLSEQLMSELAMKGYNVIELRKSDALQIMSNEGELALSRDTKTLRALQDVSGIVVGTYVSSPVRVYVNARLIDPATSYVVSAGTIEMGKTQEISRLLRSNAVPQTLERVPVRHLGYSGFLIPQYQQLPWPYSRGQRSPFEEEEDRGSFELPKKNPLKLPEPKKEGSATPPEPKLEPTA